MLASIILLKHGYIFSFCVCIIPYASFMPLFQSYTLVFSRCQYKHLVWMVIFINFTYSSFLNLPMLLFHGIFLHLNDQTVVLANHNTIPVMQLPSIILYSMTLTSSYFPSFLPYFVLLFLAFLPILSKDSSSLSNISSSSSSNADVNTRLWPWH